jgi:hypothetical protein
LKQSTVELPMDRCLVVVQNSNNNDSCRNTIEIVQGKMGPQSNTQTNYCEMSTICVGHVSRSEKGQEQMVSDETKRLSCGDYLRFCREIRYHCDCDCDYSLCCFGKAGKLGAFRSFLRSTEDDLLIRVVVKNSENTIGSSSYDLSFKPLP